MKKNISDNKKTTVRSLEKKLWVTEQIMELVLNYLVFLCVLTAVSVPFGALDSPFWYWLIPVIMPFWFWTLRQKVNSLSVFLLLHLPVAGIVAGSGFALRINRIFWIVMLIFSAVLYTVNSVYTRVKERRGEAVPVGFAALITIIACLTCAYMGSEKSVNRILIFVLVYAFWWLIRNFIQYFCDYLLTNRNAAGVMPERSIFMISIQNVLVCSIAAVAAIAALIWSPVSGWLTAQIKKLGYLFLKAIAFLIQLLIKDNSAEEEALDTPLPEMAGQITGIVESAEPSWWIQFLEMLFYILGIGFTLVFIVMMVVMIARMLIEGFYEKRYEKKEVLVEGFLEEEERIGKKKETKESRLPLLGGTPEQKIRRIFWKTVQAEYEKLGDQEPDRSQTARQFAGKFGGEKSGDWEALAALYEKARYGENSVTKEECRQAGILARRIRR